MKEGSCSQLPDGLSAPPISPQPMCARTTSAGDAGLSRQCSWWPHAARWVAWVVFSSVSYSNNMIRFLHLGHQCLSVHPRKVLLCPLGDFGSMWQKGVDISKATQATINTPQRAARPFQLFRAFYNEARVLFPAHLWSLGRTSEEEPTSCGGNINNTLRDLMVLPYQKKESLRVTF